MELRRAPHGDSYRVPSRTALRLTDNLLRNRLRLRTSPTSPTIACRSACNCKVIELTVVKPSALSRHLQRQTGSSQKRPLRPNDFSKIAKRYTNKERLLIFALHSPHVSTWPTTVVSDHPAGQPQQQRPSVSTRRTPEARARTRCRRPRTQSRRQTRRHPATTPTRPTRSCRTSRARSPTPPSRPGLPRPRPDRPRPWSSCLSTRPTRPTTTTSTPGPTK